MGILRGINYRIWILIIALALAAPMTQIGIQFISPNDTAPTGMMLAGDSSVLLQCMRMFTSDFYSPYASVESSIGLSSYRFFMAPHFWLYAPLGPMAKLLHISEFLLLGFANGISAFIYLLAVYLLMRNIAKSNADLAFVLFCLSGGLAGLIYIGSGIAGLPASISRRFFNPTFDITSIMLLMKSKYSSTCSCRQTGTR